MTAATLTHAFVSAITDGTDATLVRPSNWNAQHNLFMGFRSVTGTTDTIANADHLSLIRYNSASAVAVSLPAPAGGNMPLGWDVSLYNMGAGVATVTCGGVATINGSATMTLNQGEGVRLLGTGTNDYAGLKFGAAAKTLSAKTTVFTASGTWTPQTGMVFSILECIGCGGGGGGVASNATFDVWGAGGGSGGYSRAMKTAAQVGASQTVTIGSAGTAGSTAGGNGGNGGAVSIGALCVANGGLGGGGLASGVITPLPAGGAGGAPGTGDIAAAGSPGGGGGYSSAINHGGFGGSGSFGGGGNTAQIAANGQAAGVAGRAYGSGGSGGITGGSGSNIAGAVGSTGVAVVTEFIMS